MAIAMRRVLIAVMGLSLLVTAGCTGEESCGNIVTIMVKLGAEKNIGNLTACEWQVLFSELPSLAQTFGLNLQGYTLPQLNDEEAQAIVDFLAAHNITTVNQLITAVQTGTITPADIPPVLLNLFVSAMSQSSGT